MFSPSSCARCNIVVEVLSSRGLCAECAATDNTAEPTSQLVQNPLPASAPSTVSGGRNVVADNSTASHRAAAGTNTPPAEALLPPPPSVPVGYDLVERLGGGGMGDVYLVREQLSRRLVAMKFLRHPGDPAAFQRFVVELQVMAKLDHPNIVRVLAHDFLRVQPYFTMEYLPGGPLGRSPAVGAPLLPQEAVRIIRAVATAVAVLHASQVIHRDLKPSNILLDSDGTPKVADLGLAKRLDELDELTRTHGALGTPSYMPPEQISRANGEIGPWSDVYGLGATLYTLLTGRAPFVETHEEIILQVLADAPPRPRALRPELSMGLEAVVLKCLAKDPKDRYPAVADLLADLDRAEAGEKPLAPLQTPGRRARQWIKRHRRSIAVSALVAVVVVGAVALGMAFASIWGEPERAAPPDPLAEMQKRLKAGREVELVPVTGKPAWHEWVIGAPELSTSPTGDGTCAFEALECALLELCPDPMSEHYRVRAELRHRQSRNAAGPELNAVGVYFGRSRLVGANGIQAQAFLTVAFADTPRKPDPPGKFAQLRRAILFQRPNRNMDLAQGGIRNTKFVQAAAPPGPWRPIEIEVSPEGVKAFWESPTGAMVPFADLTTAAMRAEYAKLDQKFAPLPPGHNLTMPRWEPRMPLGIWCNDAALDIRNVILTPLN